MRRLLVALLTLLFATSAALSVIAGFLAAETPGTKLSLILWILAPLAAFIIGGAPVPINEMVRTTRRQIKIEVRKIEFTYELRLPDGTVQRFHFTDSQKIRKE